MNSPLDRIVIECCLSDARFNPAQNIEMPRIRAVPTTQPPSPLTGRISEVTPLQEGEFTQVYRGTLRIPGSKAIDVVIKTDAYAAVARPAAFKREINAYERKLHSWQGYLIPNCYGLYQVEDDDQVVSFLVLEFSGLPIDFNVEYPEDLKAEILNKLSTLHRAGFCHGDLEDYNIVVDDGQVMFIDLEDVEPHECQVKQAIIPDDLVPASAEFGCKEIYHIAYMLKVWQKRFVHFYGHDFNLSEIKPGGAGHLLRRVRFRIRTESEFERAYTEAEKLIQDLEEWREWYNTITDDERKYTLFPESGSASEPEDSSSGSSATDSSSDSESRTSTANDTSHVS